MDNEKTVVQYMLTTEDNPYNPFTEWDKWNVFDEQMGYYTNNYLARIVQYSSEMSDLAIVKAVNAAILEILFHNVTGNYVRVEEATFEAVMAAFS